MTESDTLTTAVFGQRPSRLANLEAENYALRALGRHLNQPSDGLLRYFTQILHEQGRAGTVGISLIESPSEGTPILRWTALSGVYAPYEGELIPQDASPCGDCLSKGSAQLYSDPARQFTALQNKEPAVVEALVVPLASESAVFGTVWLLSHDPQQRFDAEDLRLLSSLSEFVAALLANAQQRQMAVAEPPQREQWLWRMAETIEAVFWLSDATDRSFRYISPAYDRIWGRDRRRLYTNFGEFFEAVHPDDRDRIRAAASRCLVQEQFETEYRIVRPDGQIRWIRDNGFLIRDQQGEPDQLVGFAEDITERKQVEDALRKSEARLRLAIDIGHMGTWDWNLETDELMWSEGHFLLLGFQPGECEPDYQRWLDIVHPDDVEATTAAIQRAMTDQIEYHHEYRTVWRDRTVHWIEARGQFFYTATGRPSRMIGVMIDITERKQVEDTLRQNSAILNTINQATPTLIYVKDQHGRIRMGNPAVFRALGKSESEIIGHTDAEFCLNPEDAKAIRAHDCLVMETGQIHVFEEIINLPEGRRTFLSTKSPYPDESGNMIGLIGVSLDITERKRAEDALRRSEERLKLAIEARKMVVLEWDPRNNAIVTTSNFSEVYGLTDIQAVRQGLTLIHPDDLENHRDAVEQAIARGGSYRSEFRIIRPDNGKTVWLEERGQAVVDANGAIQKVIGVALDISERKQAEAEIAALNRDLQDRVNELQTLFEVIPVGILITQDPEFKRIQANPAFAEMLGISATGNASDTPPNNDAPVPYKMLKDGKELMEDEIPLRRAALHNIRVERAEVDILRNQDGALFNLYGYAAPLIDEQGKARGAVGAFLDITERKRIEAAQQILAEASSVLVRSLDLQTVLTSVVQLVVPTLADFCFLDTVTAEGEVQRTAWHHRNPETQTWFDQIQQFMPPRDATEDPVIQVLASGRSRLISEVCDGWMQSTAVTVEHLAFMQRCQLRSVIAVPLIARERGLGVLTFCLTAESNRHYQHADLVLAEELANRVALALDNAHLYHQAQEANRIKDEFLAVLSHELRSPLNPILGWANLLRKGTLDPAKTAHALETIERNAKLQVQLIEDLLDVSRILRGKMSLTLAPTNLITTTKAAIETVQLAAEAKGIDLQFTISEFDADPDGQQPNLSAIAQQSEHPTSNIQNPKFQVRGDSARLQQVIWNLLSNAVKFTPSGGQVTIHLSEAMGPMMMDSSQPAVDHPTGDALNPQTHYAQIQVTDTGEGINPAFLPYVFDYFRQEDGKTTRRFGGLGLGLAIVRYLTEQHGGTVKAESAGEGNGATFTVKLPLMPAKPGRPPTPGMLPSHLASPPARLAGRQIVIVDDEADIRALLVFILEQAGAEVRVAASAVEALTLIARSQPDVLLCDIGMPSVDGYMLIRQVRALPSDQGGAIRAIALTAYAGEGDAQQAIEAGFHRHLAKPIEPDVLVQAIANLIQSPGNDHFP